MGKKIIQVTADPDLIDMIDHVRDGRPRAEVMREAFLQYYSKARRDELDRAYLEGYRKRPDEGAILAAQGEMLKDVFSKEKW